YQWSTGPAGVVEVSHPMSQPGCSVQIYDRGAAGCLGVTHGNAERRVFVKRKHITYLVSRGKQVHQRQFSCAGVSENVTHSCSDEHLKQSLGPGHFWHNGHLSPESCLSFEKPRNYIPVDNRDEGRLTRYREAGSGFCESRV